MRRFLLLLRLLTVLNILALFALTILAPARTADAAEPAGRVETARAGLTAIRGGRAAALDAGSEVYEFDILETDSTGSAVIRFIDDSTLEMKSGTRVDLKEVVFSDERVRFNAGIAHGAARVITGAIVKINPRGFKMTTPSCSIGIRGTTLYVEVSEHREFITVEDLSERSAVTVTNHATKKTYTLTAVEDSVTVGPVERVDPLTGAVSTTTETTTQGGGVVEGDVGAISGREKGTTSRGAPGRQGNGDRDKGSGPISGKPSDSGDDCCGDNNSVPSR